MLQGWSNEFYEADQLPQDVHDLDSLKSEMAVIPEEFYPRMPYAVVTPQNFATFFYVHRRWAQLHECPVQWDFQEQWSGSARPSGNASR